MALMKHVASFIGNSMASLSLLSSMQYASCPLKMFSLLHPFLLIFFTKKNSFCMPIFMRNSSPIFMRNSSPQERLYRLLLLFACLDPLKHISLT